MVSPYLAPETDPTTMPRVLNSMAKDFLTALALASILGLLLFATEGCEPDMPHPRHCAFEQTAQ